MSTSTNVVEPLISELADDPDMSDLVSEFAAELPKRAEAMASCVAAEDLATIRSLAHQLKGSAGGYGYPVITDVAAKLEQSAKSNAELAVITEQINELVSLCQRARAGV